jgi:hypothetical protein
MFSKIDIGFRHARKFFSSLDEEHLTDVQHCMALLAFPADTQLSPYKELLDDSRWNQLIEQFRNENYRLFQLSSQSVFTVALQAGLSALKTPYPFLLQLTMDNIHRQKHWYYSDALYSWQAIIRDGKKNEEILKHFLGMSNR